MLQANLNNYKFNYVKNGNGENLLLVHGSASDYRTWNKQRKKLGNYYNTIAYSRRYHWPNEKIHAKEDYDMAQHVEDLEGFLKFLSNDPVHLIGHSYGALVCLLLAIRDSKQIRSLTLAEPPAVALYVSNSPRPTEILKLLFSKPKLALAIVKFGSKGISPATKALKQGNLEKALEVFGKATLGANAYLSLSESRLKQARDNFIKAELLGSGFLPLNKKKIESIKLPTLLVYGEKSPLLWQYLLDELENLIPHSEKVMIPEASHIMHEDNASNFNSIVLSFLNRNEKK